jgi:hypothetical protein
MSPRKLVAANLYPPLRHNSVRKASPYCQRAGSVKRKPDDGNSYAAVVTARILPAAASKNPERIEQLNVGIAKVTSLCDKIETAINSVENDPVKMILIDINAAIKIINKTIPRFSKSSRHRLTRSRFRNPVRNSTT